MKKLSNSAAITYTTKLTKNEEPLLNELRQRGISTSAGLRLLVEYYTYKISVGELDIKTLLDRQLW